jgi:hypothetical protein
VYKAHQLLKNQALKVVGVDVQKPTVQKAIQTQLVAQLEIATNF